MLEHTRSPMITHVSSSSLIHLSPRFILDDDEHDHPAQSPTTLFIHQSYLQPCSV